MAEKALTAVIQEAYILYASLKPAFDDIQNGVASLDLLRDKPVGNIRIPNQALRPFLKEGRLVQVLEDWCPPFPGYHLYYPSRRQNSPAFALLIEALRWRS